MKIKLEGVRNVRDFSEFGYPWAIRSADLFTMSDSDRVLLQNQYGVKTVIDLRTSQEASENPDRDIPGARYLHMPLFDNTMPGISHEEETDRQTSLIPDLRDLYRFLTSDPGSRAQIRNVLAVINDPNREGAVLWHCTEGKDRCGLISAIFLMSHGYDDETVLKDYLKTNETALARAQNYYDSVLSQTGDQQTAQRVYDAFVAKEEYILPVLDQLKELLPETQPETERI